MKDSLAPFKGANAIPCPLGMDIEFGFCVFTLSDLCRDFSLREEHTINSTFQIK